MTVVGNSGGYLQGGASALQQSVGASDASFPTAASPAAPIGAGSISTSYVPVAGAQSGAATGGGLLDGSVPGGALVGAARGIGNASTAATAKQLEATSVPVNTAAATPAQVAGPPAWSSAWAQKFIDAGVDAATVQQFTLTGANGADAATLQASLDEVDASTKVQLEQFAAQHPDEYKELRSIKSVTKGTLVQLAMQVNAGQVSKADLETQVQAAKSGNDVLGTMLKSFLPWTFIPAWGAVRFALSPLFGGKDPISGEKIKLDFWNNGMAGWMDAAGAVAGAVTISNYARGVNQVFAGNRAMAEGGTAAKIAAAQGVDNLTGWKKALSYVPGTNSNRIISGLSHVKDIEAGIAKLPQGSVARKLAEDALAGATRGEINLVGTSAQKFGFGFQTDTRGFVMGRSKALSSTILTGRNPTILIDSYLKGPSTVAHFASAAADLGDDVSKAQLLKDATAGVAGDVLKPKQIENMIRGQVLGTASKDLAASGYIQRPTSILGKLRPGGLEDSFRAIDALGTSKLGATRGAMSMFKGLPTLGKFGIGAAIVGAVGGAGYLFGIKPQLDAQKAALAAAAAVPAATGGGATGTGGAGQQVTPELQGALEQLAQASPAQQKQYLEQVQASIAQLSAIAKPTAEQQQQLQQAKFELPLMLQAINVGQGQGASQAQGQQQAPQAGQAQQQYQSQPIGATG
jgi:hypothetical protein